MLPVPVPVCPPPKHPTTSMKTPFHFGHKHGLVLGGREPGAILGGSREQSSSSASVTNWAIVSLSFPIRRPHFLHLEKQRPQLSGSVHRCRTENLVQIPALPLTSHLILDKLLDLSVPQFLTSKAEVTIVSASWDCAGCDRS
ncbi:hypothetical protein HJG60_010689 [Phyllostomus discolor]|uniref:Uncharacterized protein n=1 Tax=Phyllostomus discolor TaxID=89673 RepID=A0A834ASJ4_9CHIR|nr:hypothetical protein HJG60_010689 [Phyllostomus discolor]